MYRRTFSSVVLFSKSIIWTLAAEEVTFISAFRPCVVNALFGVLDATDPKGRNLTLYIDPT